MNKHVIIVNPIFEDNIHETQVIEINDLPNKKIKCFSYDNICACACFMVCFFWFFYY